MKTNYMQESGARATARKIIEDVSKLHRVKLERKISKHSALLIVDMQKYFASDSSNACIPAMKEIVPHVDLLMNKFYRLGCPIILTKHFNSAESDNSMLRFWNGYLDKSSEHFEIVSGLQVPRNAFIIEKETYNAFHQTKLDEILSALNVRKLYICGVFSHLCVETTARAAFVANYDVSLVADCTASYMYEYHFATVLNLSHGVCSISLSDELEAYDE